MFHDNVGCTRKFDSKSVHRVLQSQRLVTPRLLVGAFLLATFVRTVPADTINFDAIDASAGDVILDNLNPYQGFNWKNISVYTSVPGFPGYNNGIVSGANAAYTAGDALGSPIIGSITASSPFNFISGYLGSGWYNGLAVTLNGLSNGAQRFSQTVTVSTAGAQFFAFNFTGINELDIFSTVSATTSDPYGCGPSSCSQITLDDVTLTPAPASPEPFSFALTALGILAIAAYGRFKNILFSKN